jgi:filamentous hemagglutinin
MNQGIFKLVYSKVLNMYVPASEVAKTRNGKSSTKRMRRLAKQAFFLVYIGSAPYALADAPAGLDLTSATNAVIANTTANSMTIQQTADKAILDWRQLNLNAGELLKFNQQRTWSALNRINDIAPSKIFGTIKADGNLYLINPNGIIFGNGSQIDVGGSLYAGSLNITDDLFNRGLLSDPANPVFSATGGFVMVEEGAKLYAESGGRVVLLAPSVENNGLIETPDGQVILAAGEKVYLQALTTDDVKNAKFADKNPAHLLVEVDAGGQATNIGQIIADRGNVSMVGLAVNQEGIVSASTSVRANGSVTLLARDTVDTTDVLGEAVNYRATRGGKVTLGENSLTEVRVEVNDTEEVSLAQLAALPLAKSKVNISGANVDIKGKIIAKSGEVNISNGPSTDANNIKMDRLYLDKTSVIDVSGIDATAPMERNQLEIELFSDQLKDVPLLRDSQLFKEKVFVDKRKGTTLTDTKPFELLKKQTVAESLTKGGTVTLGGEAIQREGSVIDVSGGSTTFLPGQIKETTLTYNGKAIPISEINPNTTLPDVSDIKIQRFEKWGVARVWDLSGGGTKGNGRIVKLSDLNKVSPVGALQAGYKVGDDAGKIVSVDSTETTKVSAFTVQEGTLLANTFTGETQRLPGQAPKGGEITLAGNFTSGASKLPDDFDTDTVLSDGDTLRKANTDFIKNGFNRITLLGEVNTDLNVAPNGSVDVQSTTVGSTTYGAVNANIIAPGSDITLTNVNVADGVNISSAGTFTNDRPAVGGAQQALAVNAGDISVNTQLAGTIGKNVTFDASAGAFVDAQGKLFKGEAGDIDLVVTGTNVGQDGTLKAYGFNQGGRLSITSDTKVNVGGIAEAGAINLATNFFKQGGFAEYNISTDGDVVIGDGGKTDVYATMQTLRADSGLINQNNSQSIIDVAPIWSAPEFARPATSISLATTNNDKKLTLNENATIRTDAGGTVSLSAERKMEVLGKVETPAGEVNLNINADPNTAGNNDYNPSNGIFIGENAQLAAKGVYRTLPSENGLLNAEILNGGEINIVGANATEFKGIGTVVLKEGAILDVSGAAGQVDAVLQSGIKRETQYGDAGSINISARDGLLLDGDFKAQAKGTGRNGNLSLTLDTAVITPPLRQPTVGSTFKITQNKQLLADGLNPGDPVLPEATTTSQINAIKGMAQVSADQIAQGGFDNVTINNSFGDKISLEAGANLVVPGSLTLQSAQLAVEGGGEASVNANYVAINQSIAKGNQSPIVKADNTLNINANQIAIKGDVKVSNVNNTHLKAKFDINGSGNGGFEDTAKLTAPGDITLTARQIYPNTANKLTIEATGGDSKITVNQSGEVDTPVLSAQGELTLKAANIEQNGTLKAPFGKINLEATDALVLSDNSLTSVSSEGQLIPFATTRLSGQQYSVEAYKGLEGTDANLTAKSINLKSDKVDQQAGAVLDVSGGGDMFAYEFIPGIGGSEDILAKEGYFAVSPTIGTNYAPVDSIYQGSSAAVGVGETVFLSGVKGLADGTYTKLPARYALMPGAFLVKGNVSTKLARGEVQQQLDGSILTTGYNGQLGTGARDADWSTFQVVSGSILRPASGTVSKSPSEYKITSANEFFANRITQTGVQQQLPEDAGRLSIQAGSELKLTASDVVTTKSADARGAQVDIASENIRVVANKDADTSTLQLAATDLNDLNVESLLLGGVRDVDGNTTKINAASKTVTIENNIDTTLELAELIATATDSVTVKSGAAINTNQKNTKNSAINIEATGEGALLAVSGVNDINYSRTGATNSATKGTLTIESGANINATKSVVLDATKENTLDGSVKVADGGSATLGANRILLGSPSSTESGLVVSNATLADLGQLSKFSLSSQGNIDVYGAVDFGNEDLDLTINAAGIAGRLSAGEEVNITARNFEMKNDNNALYTKPVEAENGQLLITASNVKLTGKDATNASVNAGKTTIGGFTETNINANEVRVAKNGETTFDSAQANINAGRITADTGTNFRLQSATALNTNRLATPITTATAANVTESKEGVGAKLTIQAEQLNVNSDIEVAAGNLTLISEQDLNLLSDAAISAKSADVAFYDEMVATPAGTVTLQSSTGDVNMDAGAVVDVSATKEAQAGTVNIAAISAGSTTNLDGDIKATDEKGNISGRLNIDVDKLADINVTNQRATGFGGSRQYRLRNEDNVTISAKGVEALKAKEVRVLADAGAINVTGDINATSEKGGAITLIAKNDLTLANGANLSANSTQDAASGGKVNIETAAGSLNLQTGSNIDVSGGLDGEGGNVRLRAPRNAANTDINITAVNTQVVGAKEYTAEGFKAYDATTLNAASFAKTGAYYTEADAFMRNVYGSPGLGMNRLNPTNTAFKIIPGVEVKSAGNLTVTGEVNLYDWRFDPETGVGVNNNATGLNANDRALLAGVLSLRSLSNLTINGSLNDGFDATNTVSGLNSTSFNLASGVDFTSADKLAVNAAGNLTIQNAAGGAACPFPNPLLCGAFGGGASSPAKGIRTGTGEINIASGGNFTLANDNTVVYTVGRNAEDLAGFDAPEASFKPLYLADGGDINIDVKGDVVGKEATNNSRQIVNQWLFRQGGGTANAVPKDTSWWVRPDLFKQSLATFGGGNVNINAGGNIENFSASLATTVRFDSNGSTGNQRIDGGGDLSVTAGGKIVNGTYFVAKGEAVIDGGKEISKVGSIGTVIALMDGKATVSASENATIGSVVNPTLFAASATNISGLSQVQNRGDGAYFNSYGIDSKVDVSSLTGDVSLGGVAPLLSSSGLFTTDLVDKIAGYYPGTVNATAFGGDVSLTNVRLIPAANGNLSVLADNNISIGNVLMSDADLLLFPNPQRTVKRFGEDEAEIRALSGTPVHINNETTASIIAQNGSITRAATLRSGEVVIPKATKVVAGEDIDNINISIQNLGNGDLTIVKAGNDIKGNSPSIKVAGPGEVLVEAGRNIDLGIGAGINAIGNKENAALPEDSASVTVIAGLGDQGATLDAYIEQYILPTGTGPAFIQDDAEALAEYKQNTAKVVTDYIRKINDDDTISDADALIAFNALSPEAKLIFANRHLSSELLETARVFAKTNSYQRGFDAIAALFPETDSAGDITLFNSKVSTGTNGSIDVLAPNGLVNVGLAGGSDKTDIGIVSEKFGPIRAYADKGFEVNQSKVVTQIDGDITIWVNNGDIDAGRGSKTATSVPQRIINTDVNGNTTITNVGVAAGSGIQAQSFDPDGPNGPQVEPPRGTVAAIAPRGAVDAGEAGIVAGDLFVLAPVVLNAANINAAGATQGVPTGATGVVGANFTAAPDAVSNAVQDVASNVAQAASQPIIDAAFPSLISVEVLGYGN